MRFSIVICGFNEEKNLDRCIQACLDQDFPKDEFEIIYVDNNSTDNSYGVAKKHSIITLVEIKRGPSEARNCGIKKARGEIILFLDADTKIDKNYLKNCQDKTFTDHNIGAGVGKILPLNKTWISDYLGVALFEGYPRFNRFKFLKRAPSCNLAIRSDVLKKIGNFSECLSSGGGVTRFSEDKELCERVGKAGYKILFNPHTFIYHDNASSFGRLFSVWIKGSLVRASMIRAGKNDPFSIFFRFNVPLLFILLILMSLLFSTAVSVALVALGSCGLLYLAIRSYVETGLFFQSFLIKPWMDAISIITINFSVLHYRLWSKKYD
jgi:glycosyltransferase involved in cell wall biosynthesis